MCSNYFQITKFSCCYWIRESQSLNQRCPSWVTYIFASDTYHCIILLMFIFFRESWWTCVIFHVSNFHTSTLYFHKQFTAVGEPNVWQHPWQRCWFQMVSVVGKSCKASMVALKRGGNDVCVSKTDYFHVSVMRWFVMITGASTLMRLLKLFNAPIFTYVGSLETMQWPQYGSLKLVS